MAPPGTELERSMRWVAARALASPQTLVTLTAYAVHIVGEAVDTDACLASHLSKTVNHRLVCAVAGSWAAGARGGGAQTQGGGSVSGS
jgi:hypothetical protein